MIDPLLGLLLVKNFWESIFETGNFYYGAKCSLTNFAESFFHSFLRIFVHISSSIESITLIWELLERSFPLQNLSMDGQRSSRTRHERHKSQWVNTIRGNWPLTTSFPIYGVLTKIYTGAYKAKQLDCFPLSLYSLWVCLVQSGPLPVIGVYNGIFECWP